MTSQAIPAIPLPLDGNRLAHLIHTFVTTDLKLKGDIAVHSFFIPLLFPFINHPLGDELIFSALFYLYLFAQNQIASQTSLGKVPGSLLFVLALLKAFKQGEIYLISPDIQALRIGIFRFIDSHSELIEAIDAFEHPDCKPTLGAKLKGILTPPSRKKSPPMILAGSCVHHSLSAPHTKQDPPPEYEVQNRLVAPQEPLEYADVATIVSRRLAGIGGHHTVPALAYNEPWSPGMLNLYAYHRGEVLDRMRDEFGAVVREGLEEEVTERSLKRFRDELIRKYRA